MNAIYQIYRKFYSLWSEPKDEVIPDEKYISSISFKLTKDRNIDIFCELPNVNELENSQFISISEKYAELLLFLNKGILKNKIFEILSYHAKDQNDPHVTLFVENIVSFYKMIDKEYRKLKKEQNTNVPLIRPISVFKIQ